MSQSIMINKKENIVSLVFNRADKRNALSISMLSDFCALLSEHVEDDTSALVISGAGGYFSAGADLNDLKGDKSDIAMDDAIAAAVAALERSSVPVLAAIDGPCMGAAVDLCLSCDLRLASKNSFLQVPATKLGILYNPAAVLRISRRLRSDVAFRLLVLGEKFNAPCALECGLVSYVVTEPSVLDSAHDLAKTFSSNDLDAVKATKGMLKHLETEEFDLAYWNDARDILMSSPFRRKTLEYRKNRTW